MKKTGASLYFDREKSIADPHDTKGREYGIRFTAVLVLAMSGWSIHRYLGSWPHKLPYLVTDLATRHEQQDGRSSEGSIGQLTSQIASCGIIDSKSRPVDGLSGQSRFPVWLLF